MADDKQERYEYTVTSGLRPLVIARDLETNKTHIVTGKELEELNKRNQEKQQTATLADGTVIQGQVAQMTHTSDAQQKVETKAPQEEKAAQQVFDGTSSAYVKTGPQDAYGNPIKTDQKSSESSEQSLSEQLKDAKTIEEALAKIIMQILEEMMRTYGGEKYNNLGNQLAAQGQKLDQAIDKRMENQNSLAKDNVEQKVVDNTPSRTVDQTPLTERQQQNYDKWMKQARISPEDQAQLQEKYGPKDAYNIVQKCMAEPKKVNDAMGEGFKNSKQSIEYMANLDVNKPENQAKADKVISIDPPKLNMAMMKQHQGR